MKRELTWPTVFAQRQLQDSQGKRVQTRTHGPQSLRLRHFGAKLHQRHLNTIQERVVLSKIPMVCTEESSKMALAKLGVEVAYEIGGP